MAVNIVIKNLCSGGVSALAPQRKIEIFTPAYNVKQRCIEDLLSCD